MLAGPNDRYFSFVWKALFILLCINGESVLAQSDNLIRNASFSTHSKSTYIRTNLGKGIPFAEGWNFINVGRILCNCNASFSSEDQRIGWPVRFCLPNVYRTDDCSYVQLTFHAHETNDLNRKHTSGSHASYISQELKTPMEAGKVYEVSYDIFVPSRHNGDVSSLAKHLGIGLAHYPLSDLSVNQMLHVPYVSADTLDVDRWIRVHKTIRPLCDIYHVALGVFAQNDWPDYYSEKEVSYMLDSICVRMVEDDPLTREVEVFSCYDIGADNPMSSHVSVYFESASAKLVDVDSVNLDLLVKEGRARMRCFEINGHTDDVGGEHLQLSKRRAEALKLYMKEKFQIPGKYIRINPLGKSAPAASNGTNTGRALNRRAEVYVSDISVSDVIYDEVLKASSPKEFEKAAQKWLHIADDDEKVLICVDPRLSRWHIGRSWFRIVRNVKDGYRKYPKGGLAFLLDSLTAEDQKHRTLKSSLEKLGTGQAEDIALLDRYYSLTDDEEAADIRHMAILQGLLSRTGWPLMSDVGRRAVRGVFYIINHSSDLDIISSYLPELEKACRMGEAEWLSYANMYDRWCKLQGLPQKYGTHYEVAGRKVSYYKHVSIDSVNMARTKIGLAVLPEEVGFQMKQN